MSNYNCLTMMILRKCRANYEELTSLINNTCPDQELCRKIISYLAPIQMGEKEAGNILAVDRDTADEYFYEEDQMVTMAEMGM